MNLLSSNVDNNSLKRLIFRKMYFGNLKKEEKNADKNNSGGKSKSSVLQNATSQAIAMCLDAFGNLMSGNEERSLRFGSRKCCRP